VKHRYGVEMRLTANYEPQSVCREPAHDLCAPNGRSEACMPALNGDKVRFQRKPPDVRQAPTNRTQAKVADNTGGIRLIRGGLVAE
jgi:hypothetical protein